MRPRIPASRFLAAWLLLWAVPPGHGLDLVVDDFRSDFSGSPADTARMDVAFGDTLKIAPREFRYQALVPYNLTDSVGANGRAGSTPLVVATGKGRFQAAFISWSLSHVRKDVNDGNYPRANIDVRTATVDEGTVTVPSRTRIVGDENVTDAFGGLQAMLRPPTYFNYIAEGDKYAAYWSSMDPGAYIRRTTHVQAAGGGNPDLWGRYLFKTNPPSNNPVTVGGYGEIGAAMLPGTGGTQAVIAYEANTTPGQVRFEVRWENLETGAVNTVVQNRPGTYQEDFAVAADADRNVLVIWREATTLFMAMWDSARTQIRAPVSVTAPGIGINDGSIINHYYRPYGVISLAPRTFLMVYAQSNRVYAVRVALDAVGAYTMDVWAVSPVGETANFPSLTANQDKVLVGWFRRVAANTDSLVGALIDRQGTSIDISTLRRMPLSSETISFDQVGPAWYQYHYYHAPGLALDTNGHIAATYDNQFWAKLAMTSNFAIFHDSATFTSRVRTPASLPAAVPLDPFVDSLRFIDYRVVAKNPSGAPNLNFQLAISPDGSFTDPGSGFGSFPANSVMAPAPFKYRLEPKAGGAENTTQTKIDSLIVRYNVKPRRPVIDSIRIGAAPMARYDTAAAYSVLPRKDSVRLVVNGIDADDGPPIKFYLLSGTRVLDSTVSVKSSPGNYRTEFVFLPPDSLPDPLNLSVQSQDDRQWSSLPVRFRPEFRNRVPAETLSVVRNRGSDSGGVYRPTGGGTDTVVPAANQMLVVQRGDSATVNVRLGDVNDDSVTFRVRRNGVPILTRKVPSGSTQSLKVGADSLLPLVDTITAEVEDPDTVVTFRFQVRPNRMPSLDSLALASFKRKDSTRATGRFDRLTGAADSGLIVPLDLPSVIKARASDSDAQFGDGVKFAWTVYVAKPGCAKGDLACYDKAATATGDSLQHAFQMAHEYLVLRIADSTGAFRERRVKLEYPAADTAGGPGSVGAALSALSDSLDFILGARKNSDTVKAELASTGNVPLQIHSVATGKNDKRWLDLKLAWETPGNPPRKDSLSFKGRTDSNAVPAGRPITIEPGAKLSLALSVKSDSLRGDSVITDTLVLETNDLANPFIRIPIRIAYNDLPVLRISHRGGRPGPVGGYNDEGLPDLLPVRSALVFGFSETVRVPDPTSQIRVYSFLDSVKNPAGHRPLPGAWEYRRRPAAKRSASSAADSLADTLVFRPAYDRPSDSLKVKPAPGAFIHRDLLHIYVSNAVTDRAGNALDLPLDKADRAPNTLDTIFAVQVDTGWFRVAATTPSQGDTAWDPDQPVRVRFNRKLGVPAPTGLDTLTRLDLRRVKGDSNASLRVRSTSRTGRRYDFHFLSVQDGDSTLVFRTRPKLAAFDTVTVTLSSGITDIDGLTLDGNLDGFPSAFYDPADTTDDFHFTFSTRDQEFYVFPNPFRHGDRRHREKGTITFKNINSLRGYSPGKEVVLRVHSMDGTLVFSSHRASRPAVAIGKSWASLDWDLRNNAGNLVGTGVYVYTLATGGDRVLRKGKVAVIR